MTEELVKHFVGRWQLVRSEYFNEYLAEIGMNAFFRKMACLSSPIEEIKLDGEIMTISILTRFYKHVTTHRLNQEHEIIFEKIKYKCNIKYEDEKFIMEMDPVDPSGTGKHIVAQREIVDDELILIVTVGDVVCTRAYIREVKSTK